MGPAKLQQDRGFSALPAWWGFNRAGTAAGRLQFVVTAVVEDRESLACSNRDSGHQTCIS